MFVAESLYHYTDSRGLLGILQSELTLWASHSQWMNDYEELNRGVRLILNRLDELIDSGKRDDLLGPRGQFMDHAGLDDTLVACLSEDGDSLGMWRGYADEGAFVGYAMGFDKASLLTAIEKVPRTTIEPVLYGDEAFFNALDPMLEPPIGWDLAGDLLRLAARHKGRRWESEREWRILTVLCAQPRPELRFRTGTYGIVPYVELDLSAVPLTGITVGGGSYAAERETATRRLLESVGRADAQPTLSEIRLR